MKIFKSILRWIFAMSSWFILATPSMPSAVAALDNSGYYVLQNSNLSNVKGDPNKAAHRRWQIWLYNPGATVGDRSQAWGIIDKGGLSNAYASLKSSQRFERYFSRFFGTPYPDPTATYTIPFGPVAVMDENPIPALLFQRFLKAKVRLFNAQQYLSAFYKERSDLAAGKTLARDTPENVSNEYVKLLEMSMNDSATLGKALWDFNNSRLAELDRRLSRLEDELNSFDRSKPKFLSSYNSRKSEAWQSQTFLMSHGFITQTFMLSSSILDVNWKSEIPEARYVNDVHYRISQGRILKVLVGCTDSIKSGLSITYRDDTGTIVTTTWLHWPSETLTTDAIKAIAAFYGGPVSYNMDCPS